LNVILQTISGGIAKIIENRLTVN